MSRLYVLRISLLAVAFFAAGCSQSPAEKKQERRREITEQLAQIPTLDISSRLYARAIELKSAGRCDDAEELFYQLSMRGAGFELAQYHLADCRWRALEPSLTSTAWLDAYLWMRRAAEGGAPQAQGRLALLYAQGPQTLRDVDEAAFWLRLYERNGQRKKPGYQAPFDEDSLLALGQEFSADVVERAQKRAASWQAKHWSPPASVGPQAPPQRPRREGGIDVLDPSADRNRR